MELMNAADVADKVEIYIKERGQSKNSLSAYHYILSVFIQYCEKYNNGYFSEDAALKCLSEHYKVHDINMQLSREHSRAKMAVRVCNMMISVCKGEKIKSRYLPGKAKYILSSHFENALNCYVAFYQKYEYSPKTIAAYKKTAYEFLVFAEKNGYADFQDFCEKLVYDFAQTFTRFTAVTIKHSISELHYFLKFLHTEGFILVYLDDVVKPSKSRSQLRIPSVWRKEEVLKMLSVIDRGNPVGKRDYAMLLLVTRTGLRISDVNNLKLENIDWRKKQINIIQHKTKESLSIPLLNDVGWAIIDYLQNGRPKIDSRYIFTTLVPPFKEFSPDNHQHRMIEKYIQLAGISLAEKRKIGMHSLRHTLATVMHENHENYHDISAAIGHSSVDSTSVYLKTSVELLRECALPLPEVTSDV